MPLIMFWKSKKQKLDAGRSVQWLQRAMTKAGGAGFAHVGQAGGVRGACWRIPNWALVCLKAWPLSRRIIAVLMDINEQGAKSVVGSGLPS